VIKKIYWEKLNSYIEKGLIRVNKHHKYDIWILNYTPKTQLKGLWDDYTLSCNGMVIDSKGNILARPLSKITLYDKKNPPYIDLTKKYLIFEKIDGTTILIFYYLPKMKWLIINNQSFVSEQALVAQKFMNAKHNIYNSLDKKYTYVFEILYPEDYTIIKYKTQYDLILLTGIEIATGEEMDYYQLLEKYSKYFTVLKRFNIKLTNIKDLDKYKNNKEGFVIMFENGQKFEYKFADYDYLVDMMTNISNVSIWRNLKKNYDFTVIADKLPKKQYDWITKQIKKIQNKYCDIEREALKEFIRIYHINKIIERKSFAVEAAKSEYYAILYSLYDKKPYDKTIWEKIKPKTYKTYNE